MNIIASLKQFNTNNINMTDNESNMDNTVPIGNENDYDRSQTRTIDGNILGQSADDDAISNSQDMIMLKFKVAFKSIAYNHMMVVNHQLNKWKDIKLLNKSVSIRDNLIKKSDQRDVKD